MRQDIGEAYRRVMRKAWQPSKEQGVKLKPLTAGRARAYCKATLKLWTDGRVTFNPKAYEIIEATGNHYRTWNSTIALSNWEDLNHEWSHWCFMRYGPIRRKVNGLNHHCAHHLEWERSGALWICRRQLESDFRLQP